MGAEMSTSQGAVEVVARHSGKTLVPVGYVEQHLERVLDIMDETSKDWCIVVVDGARVVGRGHGGKIMQLEPGVEYGHELVWKDSPAVSWISNKEEGNLFQYTDNEALARIHIDGAVLPGKWPLSQTTAWTVHNGQSVSSNEFETLQWTPKLEWKTFNSETDGELPKRAIIAGHHKNTELYIARIATHSGSLAAGYYDVTTKTAYAELFGVNTSKQMEILVDAKNEGDELAEGLGMMFQTLGTVVNTMEQMGGTIVPEGQGQEDSEPTPTVQSIENKVQIQSDETGDKALKDGKDLYIACVPMGWVDSEETRLETVRKELSEGADIEQNSNFFDNDDQTPLLSAMKCGFNEIAKLLISHGANTKVTDCDGRTPISFAQHVDIIDTLISTYPDINCIDDEGDTLLHKAVLHNRGLLLSMLLEKQAKDDIRNKLGQTALDLAYQQCDTYSAAILRKELTVKKDGKKLLDASYSGDDIAEVEKELAAGADCMFMETGSGYTPLHTAAFYENKATMDMMLKNHAFLNMNIMDKYHGYRLGTPVRLAARSGASWECRFVKYLVERGADWTLLDDSGKTAFEEFDKDSIKEYENEIKNIGASPLHYACKSGSNLLVECYIRQGKDVNSRDKLGATPLHYAVRAANLENMATLISHGADVNAVDASLASPLHYAAEGGLNQGHDPSAEEKTGQELSDIAASYVKTAEFLCSHGANTTIVDNEGRPPICCAQHADMVALLISNYTDINCTDDAGNTLLHTAVIQSNGLVLSMLLEKQAKDNITNKDGHTALDLAYNQGDTYCAAILRKEITVKKDGAVLWKACDSDTLADVEKELELGADCTFKYCSPFQIKQKLVPPLHVAVTKYSTEWYSSNGTSVMDILLKNHACINKAKHWEETALTAAAEDGQEALQYLIDNGADWSIQNAGGKLAPDIMNAHRTENADCFNPDYLEKLQTYEENLNEIIKSGDTPLHYACKSGSNLLVECYIRQGKDVNALDKTGSTPLHYAALAGNIELISKLVSLGADINAVDGSKATTLHYAARGGNVEMVAKLLDQGADVNAADASGATPLHCAAQEGHSEAMAALVEKGADTAARNKEDKTAADLYATITHKDGKKLYMACNGNTSDDDSDDDSDAEDAEDVDAVKKSLSYGANIEYKSFIKEETPLLAAMRRGYYKTAEVLISHGANTKAVDDKGKIAIIRAQNASIIKTLMDTYPDINCTNDERNTLLHLAVLYSRGLLLSMLVERQANDDIVNEKGQTARDIAYSKGDMYAAAILAKKITVKKDGSDLMKACKQNDLALIEKELSSDADLSYKDKKNFTSLHIAALNGNISVIDSLLQHHANINQFARWQATPLDICVENASQEWGAVKLLIERGADFTLKNFMDQTVFVSISRLNDDCAECVNYLDQIKDSEITPLHYACKSGNVLLVQCYINQKKDINAADKSGFTPLHYAAQEGHVEVIHELVGLNGADLKAVNKDNKTALDLAVTAKHATAAEWLKTYQNMG